jgi:DNA invertase Pin-like site-specific DNA recombinase
MRVLAYTRVSTDEQEAGLEAQYKAIKDECKRRDWTIYDHGEDNGYSAKDLNRPGIRYALELLRAKEASVLMVAKLDRLSRSVLDFSQLVERAQKGGWSIVCLDIGVDTTTPGGELVANVLAAVSQWERKLIGARTKEALAVKKANGVKLGRPRELDEDTRAKILTWHANGLNYNGIAHMLNHYQVPTAHGGKQWWPETVRGIVQSEGG